MLREKIEYLQKKIEKMDREIEPIKTKIVELTTEKNALETKIREVESHRKLIKDYSILVQSISREVLDARYKLLLLISMKKKEMTRELQKELETEIENAARCLQEICKHQFVIGYPSWRGWGYNNYYDRYSGARICVICGLKESPWNTYDRDEYKILVDAPCRLFGQHEDFRPENEYTDRDGYVCIRYTKHYIPLDIWQPLDELLTIFEGKEIGKIIKKY